MNAILQSLSNIEEFSCYFKELPSLESSVSKRMHKYHTRQNGVDEVCLVEEMRKVACALWEESGVHSPDSLFSVIWKLVPRFRGYQQQDAHEFMRYLLDKMHTELAEGSIFGTTIDRTSKKSTIVSEIFGGVLQSDVSIVVHEIYLWVFWLCM